MAAHRMTPARRAALKKAQAASARKRRGKGRGKLAVANRKYSRLKKTVKYTAIAGAVGAAAVGAHKGTKSYLGKRKSSRRPISKSLVHVPGHGRYTTAPKRKRPRSNPIPKGPSNSRVFKVGKSGKTVQTTKGRLVYDQNRRRQYWKSKPVPKTKRRKR